MLLYVCVHAANVHDSMGAAGVLMPLQDSQPRLEKILADQGYRGKLVEAVKNVLGWQIEIREKQDKGFVVEWKRWIVERTFAWLNNCRRLSKDYEKWPENHEGVVYVAMIRLMLRRLDK
jgi:putative transposase